MRTENGLCKEQCARANRQNTVAASLDARCTSLWLPDQSQYNAASHHTHQPTGTLHAWPFLELSKALTSDTNHDSDSIRTTVTQVEGTRLCLHASAMPACPSPNSRDHTHTHTRKIHTMYSRKTYMYLRNTHTIHIGTSSSYTRTRPDESSLLHDARHLLLQLQLPCKRALPAHGPCVPRHTCW